MFRGLQNFFIALLVVVSGPHRSLAGDAVPGGYFSQFEETRKKLTEKGTPFGEEVSEPDP